MSAGLGVLEMQTLWLIGKGPSHGYELMKGLGKIKRTKITQGTLYPLLAKLKKKKLVKAGEATARGKITYSLTTEGKKVMRRNCGEFVEIFTGIIRDFRCSSCKR